MKILAIHQATGDKPSAVDGWRIYRPLEELKKHVDWQIDHQPSLIKELEKYKNKSEFTQEEFEKTVEEVGQYDIVFSSYHPDPTAFALMQVIRDRYGTKFIMDVDDNMFAVNNDNPFWLHVTDEQVFQMQRMVVHNDWISTTTEQLAEEFRKRRKEQTGKSDDSVIVCPNFISKDYQHRPFQNKVPIIGYFGGASHYLDVNASSVLKAIKRLKRRGYKFEFQLVGMFVDKYLNKSQYSYHEGARGEDWFKLFSELNFDIALGPLVHNTFNEGKSNIKWQEATRMGAAFVASNVGPYRTLKNDSALIVENNPDSWVEALETLLSSPEYRKQMIATAQKELEANWTLDKHWQIYRDMFQTVYDSGKLKTKAKLELAPR